MAPASTVEEQLAQVRGLLERTPTDENGSNKAIRESYQQIINNLLATQLQEARTNQFRDLLERQPSEVQALQKALAIPITSFNPESLKRLDLTTLEQQLTLEKASILDLERTRGQLQKEITINDQRMVSLQQQLGKLKQTPEQTDSSRNPESNGTVPADIQLMKQNSKFSEISAQIQATELELLALPGQIELFNLQLQQINRSLNNKQIKISALQEYIQQLRRSETEAALTRIDNKESNIDSDPILLAINQQNQIYSDRLRQLIETQEASVANRTQLEQQLAQITENFSTIQQQLELNISYVGVELRRLLIRLSKPINTDLTRALINENRLKNLELNRVQLSLNQQRLDENLPAELKPELTFRYHQLLTDQLNLVKRVKEARQQLISDASQRLAVEEQVNKLIFQSQELINANLIWVPSTSQISLHWLQELTQGSEQLYTMLRKSWDSSLFSNNKMSWVVTLMVISILLTMYMLRYIMRHLNRWANQLGNVIHDKFSHTVVLFFGSLLIALPLPLASFLTAQYLIDPSNPLASSWKAGFFSMATLGGFSILISLWFSRQSSLFPAHFNCSDRFMEEIRVNIRPLLYLLTITMSSHLFLDQIDSVEVRSGPGRISFICTTIIITLIIFKLLRYRQTDPDSEVHKHPQTQIGIILLMVIQLAMLVLAAAGYVYSATVIQIIFFRVVVAVIASFVLFRLGLRWLLIEERKLAFTRARSRRAEILAARNKGSDETPPVINENLLDLQTISEQSRALLKALGILTLIMLLWLALRDLLPTLDALDSIYVWSGEISASTGEVINPVTLRDLLIGVVLLTVSMIAAYNLPGLLELLLLRHLSLSPGTGYAITSLVKYLLILVGILASFGYFGLEWSKLQWLVAAMGVGLGFGLQEIVANFISGIILLFEKPIRIGDTVTIGGLSGTVTRIQIRATTIMDWDRKEVIIPNKTFITDQLVNWTLTDSVTRIVIPVGVDYGSDLEKVRKFLLKVAIDHPGVRTEPAPDVFFINFADSTLNFELRAYVNALSDRLPVVHSLNCKIHDVFAENQINIAFPQLDVHLHQVKDKIAKEGENNSGNGY